MPLIGTSLDAVSAAGPGRAFMFDDPKAVFGIQVNYGGGLSGLTATVNLEGTLDGQHWFQMAGASYSGSGPTPATVYNDVDHSPVIGVRANLTVLTGGSNPTVTAIVAAA